MLAVEIPGSPGGPGGPGGPGSPWERDVYYIYLFIFLIFQKQQQHKRQTELTLTDSRSGKPEASMSTKVWGKKKKNISWNYYFFCFVLHIVEDVAVKCNENELTDLYPGPGGPGGPGGPRAPG